MRADLTQYGVEEARTPEEVDRLLAPGSGTVLMVVNSVCGCAAGRAGPIGHGWLIHTKRLRLLHLPCEPWAQGKF